VTVIFTDIEGSTALVESLGEAQARELFREHDRIVREVVAAHSGVEVEHVGDAFMLAFSSARRAVLCAAEIQRALEEGDVRVRIGANTGEVIAEGDRYFGRTVFLASRVAGQAAGGEILVSELTHRLAGSDEIACRERGEFELKGLKGAHRLFEVDWRQS
jgi:class 3 adenylate cyclase